MSACIHGHDAGRDTSGHCVTCRIEYKKKHRKRLRADVERPAEIAAAKAILMSAHRLRAIGVRPR